MPLGMLDRTPPPFFRQGPSALTKLAVFSALVMWWPIVSPLPEMPPLNPPGQMLYLFLQSLTPTIPASFLTFGHSMLYPIYATFPRIWGIGPLTDQLISGLIMKLVGSAILWIVIGCVFFRWANREQQQDWDELGPDQFAFEVLEVVQVQDDANFNLKDELTLLEQIWLEKLQPFGERGYNSSDRIREA